ncbi:hypothetical protein ALC57_00807 [Trachymyrmex cornetzi]|uniref:Uncharacterized protein n=1 Tax=Trachymyrmex cornetzi TaxID=471704 RepID=A0A151JRA5_9HYME|nr:hypothetical protein ALC57_00807 [Trachymyrmex cornetzi]
MGSGPERNRDREGDSGNRDAGECLEVEDAQAYGGTERVSEEDLEGLRESIIGIPLTIEGKTPIDLTDGNATDVRKVLMNAREKDGTAE